jgi:pilus assembly protein Flp/PilA
VFGSVAITDPISSEEIGVHELLRVVSRFSRHESGVTSIEYALLGSLIAVACALTVAAVGGNAATLYTSVCRAVTTAVSGAPSC